jgi:hypothetical protein
MNTYEGGMTTDRRRKNSFDILSEETIDNARLGQHNEPLATEEVVPFQHNRLEYLSTHKPREEEAPDGNMLSIGDPDPISSACDEPTNNCRGPNNTGH